MTHVAGTTPYAWPFDGRTDPRRTALLVTGCDGWWAGNASPEDPARGVIESLRTALAAVGVRVVLVAHEPIGRRGPAAGSSPVPTPGDGDTVVRAAGIDGFYGSPLDAVLSRGGRTHLLVVGFGLETTVHSTLRRANDRGYECLVVADACTSIDPALRRGSISSIEMSGGIFGAVGHAGDVLATFTPPLDTSPTSPRTEDLS